MRAFAVITLVLFGLAAQALAGPIEDGQKGLAASEAGDEYLAIYWHSRVVHGDGVSDKNRTIAYFNRGVSYQRTFQYAEAITDYDTVLERDPNFTAALVNRAKIFTAQGDLERAMADLDKAIEANPTDYKAYGARAVIWERWGNAAKAAADWRMRARLGDEPWWLMERLRRYNRI